MGDGALFGRVVRDQQVECLKHPLGQGIPCSAGASPRQQFGLRVGTNEGVSQEAWIELLRIGTDDSHVLVDASR